MRYLKGWKKLYIQVFLLSASMILLSFITETDLFRSVFTEKVGQGLCNIGSHSYRFGELPEHRHLNYRGIIYYLTGGIFLLMSIIKIISSHKEEDFK